MGIGKKISDTKTKLSLLGFKKTRVIPQGSILVTCIGSTIGKMGMAAETMSSNQQINSIVVNEKNNNDFVYYAISRAFPRYLSEVGVQAVPILSKSNFEKLPNYTTSRNEQDKIGYFLNLLDERITTQNKIINKLESLIKGLNNSFHKNIDGITTSFSDFGEAYSGLSGKSAESFGSGKPYITYMNVYQNDHIDYAQYDYVSISDGEKQSKVAYGDVLFTLSSETANEVGIGSIYLGSDKELYLNSFCFGIHIKDDSIIYPPYMAYFVSSYYFRKAIYPLAQGSTRFNMQKSDFMKNIFILPSFEQQKRFSFVLDSLSEKVGIEKQQLSLLQTEKQFLLQQMFI